ncbi:MAG TPA: glycerol-3-phosphate 1-O-acyltransferase PlsY, partial [Burkholderiales bacterium]|nr:glycerol-3-phosphate 1-O-acyltransferase PlsY [Burkholderiales bacterium]
GAYLVGSVSFAVVTSWIFRLPDPRTYGSGNPGATNVLRTGKRAAAFCTLLGDAAKGFVAVTLARHFAFVFGFGEATVAACALAVFLGHLYPLYFGFKGGKGVSTALGVLLALSPWIALVALVVFATVAALSAYASLASILAAVAAVIVSPMLLGWGPDLGAVVLIATFLVWRHRANIQRLRSGTESRLNLRRRSTPPSA